LLTAIKTRVSNGQRQGNEWRCIGDASFDSFDADQGLHGLALLEGARPSHARRGELAAARGFAIARLLRSAGRCAGNDLWKNAWPRRTPHAESLEGPDR